MTLQEALAVHLRQIDKNYAVVREACADPKHLNRESSEFQQARKLLTEAIEDCFKLKNAMAQADYLSKNAMET